MLCSGHAGLTALTAVVCVCVCVLHLQPDLECVLYSNGGAACVHLFLLHNVHLCGGMVPTGAVIHSIPACVRLPQLFWISEVILSFQDVSPGLENHAPPQEQKKNPECCH